MRLHRLILVLLLAVGCAQVTVDGERTSLPLPVAGPVKCIAKTGSDLAIDLIEAQPGHRLDVVEDAESEAHSPSSCTTRTWYARA